MATVNLRHVTSIDSTAVWSEYKKLSYRRETARQLPTRRGLSPPVHSLSPLATPMRTVESETRNKRTSSVPSVKRTLSWIGHSRSFKVILILCRQEPRVVYCHNVQLMPPLFLKLTKIRQQEHSKFVDFNDPTQVWRHPSKKCLRISTNSLYCQKLELLAYSFAADSLGLHSLVFT